MVEQVPYSDEGISALIFTSEGDMRQAINNLQSTYSGFNFVSPDNVFKVCDQPHPVVVQKMIAECQSQKVDDALDGLRNLWDQGYSAVDIVVTIFRVVKTMDAYVALNFADLPNRTTQLTDTLYSLPEYLKLEFIRVSKRLDHVSRYIH
jgi:replication factor C subunit 2/4